MKSSRLARRWLRAFAGTCLVAALAGWPLAGAAGSGGSVALTAVQRPQARVLPPGPPTGVTATAGNGSVTLTWAAPASDGGAAIIGYDVYLGTSSHGESGTSISGLIAGTSYTAGGLTNGATYYFTVDAVNDAELRSTPSAEASATPATTPGAPTGLTATAGDAQVSLSWKAPSSDGGATITGYRVYQGTGSGKLVASPKGTSVTVTGLTNSTAYTFKVTAVNTAGEGPASGAASATPVAPVSAPGAPTGLTATAGDRQVTLTWTAPASDGGAKLTGYLIYQGTSPGGESATPLNGTPVQGTKDTLTGLKNGTKYYFTVAAVNGANHQGNHSGEASATPVSAGTSASASASASTSASASGSPSPGTRASAGPVAAGGSTGPASPGSTVRAVLTSREVSEPVIVSLAAVAIAATAGAVLLSARRLHRRPRRSRPLQPPPSDVRAVPDAGRPGPVSIHEIGTDDTYTVRLEPLPAAIVTTIEEIWL